MKDENLTLLECLDCGLIERPTVKMGGLICPECRTIILYPGSAEYSKVLKAIREDISED